MKFKSLMKKKVLGINLPILIVSFVVMIVVFLVIRKKIKDNKYLSSECKKRNGTWDKKEKVCNIPPPVESSPTTSTEGSYDPTGNTGTGIQWSPNTLAGEIFRNIEGVNWYYYYDTAEKILALTDAQLRVLYKYYNENLAVEFPTITQLFASEWDDFITSKSPYDMVADRFRSLGLN